MNAYTLRDKLNETISEKEEMVALYSEQLKSEYTAQHAAVTRMVNFLQISIEELKQILRDVEEMIWDSNLQDENL